MKLKIFFLATPQIAVASLETIAALGFCEIAAVGVLPDRKSGRGMSKLACPVKVAAERLNLAILEIESREKLQQIHQNLEFDLALVIGFGMIFPAEILNEKMYLNVHFSLLPAFRGASPVQGAILAGQKFSGISIQKMEPKLDSGPIFWSQKYSIVGKKTSEVWEDFGQKTAEILPKFLQDFDQKSPAPQNEKDATFCGKIRKQDGKIDPKKESAARIFQKYLAFDVWPQIFVETEKGVVKLIQISKQKTPESVAISCAEGSEIYVQIAQLPSKKPAKIKDILRGNPNLFSSCQT